MRRAAHPERLEAIFDAVVDLEPAEASRILDRECGDDPALRAEVERLLAHDRLHGEAYLEPAPELLLGALQLAAEPVAANTPPPERIGRFRVLSLIGEGSMGVVYEGLDETLQRRVALKVLRGRSNAGAWLLREGQALARFSHPNLVTVFEVGEYEGHAFLAMELVEGPTLRSWLADERRDFADVLDLFLEVGRGLRAVHDVGLVHRDFKPENVLIGTDERPQLADFGICTRTLREAPVAAGRSLERSLVQGSGLVGTPAYMAPEVLAGERATPQSDQWSFCAALYRAAYGMPPFPLDPDWETFKRGVQQGNPTQPPRRADVPEWLAPILIRGLSNDPAARFDSMSELLQAIEGRMPRDPDINPTLVRTDVRILRVTVLAVAALSAIVLVPGDGRIDALDMVRVSAVLLAAELVVIAIRWRSMTRNHFGLRHAGLVVGATSAIFLHRLLSLRLDSPVEQILTVDLLLLTLVYGFAAVTVAPWATVPAVVALAASFTSALVPSLVEPAYVIGSVGNFVMVTLYAFRRH